MNCRTYYSVISVLIWSFLWQLVAAQSPIALDSLQQEDYRIKQLKMNQIKSYQYEQNRIDSIKSILENNTVSSLQDSIDRLMIVVDDLESAKRSIMQYKQDTTSVISLEKEIKNRQAINNNLIAKQNELQANLKRQHEKFAIEKKSIEEKENKIKNKIKTDRIEVERALESMRTKVYQLNLSNINEEAIKIDKISSNKYYKEKKLFARESKEVADLKFLYEIKSVLHKPYDQRAVIDIIARSTNYSCHSPQDNDHKEKLISLVSVYCRFTKELSLAIDRHVYQGKPFSMSIDPLYGYLYNTVYDANGKIKNLNSISINQNFDCNE